VIAQCHDNGVLVVSMCGKVAHAVRAVEAGCDLVVAQGTDTIEETAYLTHRSLRTDKPVVFTGAMRTSEDASWDGPANLTDSVRVAASPVLRGAGVLVVFNGRVYSASDVTKVETFHPDAFDSPGLGPIATLDGECVVVRRRLVAERPVIVPSDGLASPVDIVFSSAGADSRFLDLARASARGVVVAAAHHQNTDGGRVGHRHGRAFCRRAGRGLQGRVGNVEAENVFVAQLE